MELDFNLLITGARYFGYFCRNRQTVVRLHEGMGPYYGISWSERLIYVLARNSGDGDTVLCFDNSLKEVGVINLKRDLDGHQIVYCKSFLYITATRENSILRVDPTSGEQTTFNWSGYTSDINHINAISPAEDGTFWISQDNKHGVLSELVRVSLESLSILEKFYMGSRDTGTHNIENDHIVASGAESLLFRRIVHNDFRLVHVVQEGFCRGIAFHRRHPGHQLVMLGVSRILSRAERMDPFEGYVRVLCGTSYRQLDEIEVPDIGQVHDLRTFDQPSHNGISFNLNVA